MTTGMIHHSRPAQNSPLRTMPASPSNQFHQSINRSSEYYLQRNSRHPLNQEGTGQIAIPIHPAILPTSPKTSKLCTSVNSPKPPIFNTSTLGSVWLSVNTYRNSPATSLSSPPAPLALATGAPNGTTPLRSPVVESRTVMLGTPASMTKRES